MHQHYQELPKNTSNYVPLSPLSFLARTADIFGDRTAIIYEDRHYTWEQTYDRCQSLASALVGLGLGLGDTVSVIAANTPEMYEAHFGIPMAGCVLNTINTRLEAETIAYILADSDSKLLIADTAFHETIEAALRILDYDIEVVDIRDAAVGQMPNIGKIDYETFIRSGDDDFSWDLPQDEWQALSLSYTSGTSGRPKGVVYHHRGSYLMSFGTVAAWQLGQHPTYLYTVPMFHCNGWGHAWTMALLVAKVVLTRTITAEAIFDLVSKHDVTHFGGAPIVLGMLVHTPKNEQLNLTGRTIKVMTAGAPPPPSILEKLTAMGFEVMQVYGLTESYGHVAQCVWREEWNDLPFSEKAELQSWQGVSFPMNEKVAVVDNKTGQLVPRDGETQGEIVIRGNTVMKGYYKNPKANEDAMRGGWFYSGDAAVWHKNGYVQIKDRLKDVIISGGENISSVEVEGYLYRHPMIGAAAVVAKPDEKWGEVPCAFVELKSDASISSDELSDWCRTQMAGFKRPKEFIFGALPKTATGKIQKFILRERARKLI
jgi:fatty-acyl-CoA synthase